MVAHLKPDNGSQATFNSDIASIFTDSFIADVTKRGLFALSFMDTANIGSSGATFNAVKAGITKYASSSLAPYAAPAAGGATVGAGASSGKSAAAGLSSSRPSPSASSSPRVGPSPSPGSATPGQLKTDDVSGSRAGALTSAKPGGHVVTGITVTVLLLTLPAAATAFWLRRRLKLQAPRSPHR
jgi:hypothetical protein